MKMILRYFVRGLLIVVPVGLTIMVLVYIFTGLDRTFRGIFEIPKVPGLGLLLGLTATLGLVLVVGFLASNFIGRRFFAIVDSIFAKLPLVKILYGSIRDLVQAFAGEKKRFDKPVLVTLSPDGVKAVGFITGEGLDNLGLGDHVAVYLPQSYNFAGNVLIFPRQAVQPLNISSSEAMTFIVSGGVSGRNQTGKLNG